WDGLLAVSGESGTLRKRYRGTVADHRLRGKTGALDDARALVGTVAGPQGERLHFAILASELSEPSILVARALQDVIVYALAEHLYGCVRVPLPQETPAPTEQAPPAFTLQCAA
ncbi:MAG TPA: D-alanyl-D-alanine carboxypeptidase, partial [Egibacteraceae bacterium]|nr:D-alanyl-D-alanine carboxypeptidase [Egibacteraceae bacterium]